MIKIGNKVRVIAETDPFFGGEYIVTQLNVHGTLNFMVDLRNGTSRIYSRSEVEVISNNATDSSGCKHEFVDVVGLFGSLGRSCKHCDMKEELCRDDEIGGLFYD